MFVFLSMTFVVETLRMMLGLPPLGASPIIGLLIGFYWAWKFHRKEIWSTFIFLIILGYCGWAAFLFYDLSFDGQWYHQDAIIHLRNGWNPFWDAPLAHETVSGFNANYVNHYAKAPWTLASAFYQTLPYIQWSKAGNLMWLATSYLVTLGALYRWTQRPFVSSMVALLLALSPVAVGQTLSFYVDGQLYSLLLILIIFLADIFIDGPSFYRWFSVGLAFIYLSNIKFTGLIYACVFFLGLLLIVVFKHKKIWWNVLSRGALIFTLAFFVVGHCTYVRNWKDKGHPFYPLMGENNEGTRVAQVHYPKNFFELNPVQRWNAATFHYPGYTSPTDFPSHPKKMSHRKTVRETFSYYRLHQPMVIAPLGPFSAELILMMAPFTDNVSLRILDSVKKEKLFLYHDERQNTEKEQKETGEKYKKITRFEVEIREDLAKFYAYDSLENINIIFAKMNKTFFKYNKQFFKFVDFDNFLKLEEQQKKDFLSYNEVEEIKDKKKKREVLDKIKN